MLRIKLIFPDGNSDTYDVHEVVIQDRSAIIRSQEDVIVISEDDSDQKW
jgi:hypothetical protein